MDNYIIDLVDIKDIKPSDTVLHNDEIKTVCKNNIKYSGFCGRKLFGDNYMLGHKKVKKVTFMTYKQLEEHSKGVKQ